MSNKKAVLYKGKKYRSLTELTNNLGVSYSALTTRMYRQGESLETAIDTLISISNEEKIEYKGNKYESLAELSHSLGLEYGTLVTRIRRQKMTLEDAIEEGISMRKVILWGNEHKTLKSLSDYYGIDHYALQFRLSNGLALEDSVIDLLSKSPLVFKGKRYKSLTSLCNEYTIDIGAVFKRLKSGWSLADSLTTPIRKVIREGSSYKYNGKIYTSKRELAESQGYSLIFLNSVCKQIGKDVYFTLTLLNNFFKNYGGNRPSIISRVPSIIYNDVWYPTYIELYADIDTEKMQVHSYMNKHKITSAPHALSEMMIKTELRWFDKQTNLFASVSQLETGYKSRVRTLEKNGVIERKECRVYQTLNYYPLGYCATPADDFKVYLSNHIKRSD